MTRIPLIFALTLIAACSQNPDGSTSLGLKGSPVWFASASPEAIAAHFAERCQAYGYRPGTAEMTRCIHDSAEAGRAQAQQTAAYTSQAFGRAQANAQPSRATRHDGRASLCARMTGSMARRRLKAGSGWI